MKRPLRFVATLCVLLFAQIASAQPSEDAPVDFEAAPSSNFGYLDYTTLALYFAVLVGMGVYFSRRKADTQNYFLGGRRIPWWAVGISIFGTSLSSITYLAIPAAAYTTNWVTILANLGIVLVAPIVVWFYLPHYRASPITTAYEYLERRFNTATRLYGSVVFMAFQIGRISIVLYLPAIALSAATGIDTTTSIILMGVLATIYTVIGGIEAVIWTDVLQAIVLTTGALLALGIIIANVDGGVPEMWTMAVEADKFHTFNWTWDVTEAAAWVLIVGSAFASLYPYTADQTVIQRFLSTATTKDAAKAIWTNAWLTIPISLLFFGLGTALWTYFESNPAQVDPDVPNDAILPLFIVRAFPAGLGGLLIAGIFAAAMSSLDSSLNSLSAVVVNDYYRRFWPGRTDRQALWLARGVTVFFGILGTGSALYVATLESQAIFEAYLQLLSLVGGGLAGIFALGVFTTRASGFGAILGAVTSAGVLAYVRTTPVHFQLHAVIGFLVAFTVGYVASLVLPAKAGN